MKYGEVPNSEIFARGIDQANVEDIVTDILADVKMNGDEALRSYCRKFDGFTEDEFALEVSEAELFAVEEFPDDNANQKTSKISFGFINVAITLIDAVS